MAVVGYAALLGRAPTWWWLVATLATRLAVCTVPLAVVFIGEEHTGSYAWGAAIAGAYAAGEAIGAPRMGARFQCRPLRRELCLVSVAEAACLLGVVVSLRFGLPVGAVLLAAVGGGVATGTFGGLRTLLVTSAPTGRASAMALDVMVNQVCQIVGPVLAAGAVVLGSADLSLVIVSVGLFGAVAVAGKLPESLGGDGGSRRGSAWRVAAAIWPAAVVVTVVLAMQAVLEEVLPSLLAQRGGSPGWAGPRSPGWR